MLSNRMYNNLKTLNLNKELLKDFKDLLNNMDVYSINETKKGVIITTIKDIGIIPDFLNLNGFKWSIDCNIAYDHIYFKIDKKGFLE